MIEEQHEPLKRRLRADPEQQQARQQDSEDRDAPHRRYQRASIRQIEQACLRREAQEEAPVYHAACPSLDRPDGRCIQSPLPASLDLQTMTKRAIITGITGQDGSYLAELLLSQGLRRYGRRPPLQCPEPLAHRAPARLHRASSGRSARPAVDHPRARVVSRTRSTTSRPMSFVPTSWDQPVLTGEFNAQGVTRVLEAIRVVDPRSASIRLPAAKCSARSARRRRPR